MDGPLGKILESLAHGLASRNDAPAQGRGLTIVAKLEMHIPLKCLHK